MKRKRDSEDTRYDLIASKTILYLGVVILISSLIYMIANFTKADTIITTIWLPFMIAGVFLVFMSQIIRWYVRFEK